MKKYLLLFFFSQVCLASSFEDIKVLGKVQHDQNGLTLIRTLEGDAIPSMLEKPELQKEVTALQPGDDVVVEGHITYLSTSNDRGSNLKPIFVISSLRPISLSRLGKAGQSTYIDRIPSPMSTKSYAPISIPVSTEVVSAITLTSSLLLMQSLTASPEEPDFNRQLNSGLIIFAGALATSVFLYEQIFVPPHKGKNND